MTLAWMCKKQTAVSHSSAEAEVISLDAGLRLEGIPSLTLWDQIAEVFALKKIQKDTPKVPCPRTALEYLERYSFFCVSVFSGVN